jgi:ankyrin repeat protein
MYERHYRNIITSQYSYTQEFYEACMNGDFELAVCYLKLGVNLNVRYEHGQNLLHIACMKNFYGMVQLLMKFGCNEFLRDNFGRTALHYAAMSNSVSIVRYLVEKNTFSNDDSWSDMLTKQFLNNQDNDGKTAIHLACENNHKESLRVIVSSCMADLNIEANVSGHKQTPLMIAYFKNYWEIFELLLKNGSNVNRLILKDICIRGNSTALSILQRYFNNKSLACMIFEDPNSTDRNSLLYMAMKYSNNLDFVTKLFEIGVKLKKNDLIDYFNELRFFKHLSKTVTVNTFENYFNKFVIHLEYVIRLFKYYSFSEECSTNDAVMDSTSTAMMNEIFNEFNLCYTENKSNSNDYLILFYLSLIYDVYSHLLSLKFDNSNKNKNEKVLNLKTRINFMFALAIFSSQLDCRKKAIRKWFENKFINNLNLVKIGKIFNESISAPWSLQALCRSTIRTKINNIDYVLNDRNLIKNLKLPEIYVRYLKFEFI